MVIQVLPFQVLLLGPSVVHTFQFISTKGEEAKDFDSRAENDEASEPAFVRAHVARSLRM
jgi:hypothetical protein